MISYQKLLLVFLHTFKYYHKFKFKMTFCVRATCRHSLLLYNHELKYQECEGCHLALVMPFGARVWRGGIKHIVNPQLEPVSGCWSGAGSTAVLTQGTSGIDRQKERWEINIIKGKDCNLM